MSGLDLGTLKIGVAVDSTTAIESIKRVDTEVDKVTKSNSERLKKMGDDFTKAGKTLTLGLTTPLVALGAASFKLGTDMTETMSKVEVVFGANANTIKLFGETALESMGMASQSAMDMAALFGDMGNGMGLSKRQVLDYSTSLTQLAADMASFKNVSIERAQTALTGVYTGETEALKSLGIVMTQANLTEFARSQGIRKNIADMTQREQVELRYQYVMAKTIDAQGDYARTSDSAANKMRTFQESVKELGAELGEVIIPMITPVIDFFTSCVKWIGSLDDGTKKFIVTVGGLLAAVGPILLIIGSVAKTITSVSSAITSLNTVSNLFNNLAGNATFITFTKWAAVIIGVVAAVTALVVAINYLIGKGNEMNKMVSDISGAMQSVSSNKPMPRYANGTLSAQGGWSVVGEVGRELMYVPPNAKVFSNNQTEKMLSGGGTTINGPITVQANNVQDFLSELQLYVRRGATI